MSSFRIPSNPGPSNPNMPFQSPSQARESIFTEAMRDRQARGKDPYRKPGPVAPVVPAATQQPMSQADLDQVAEDEMNAREARLGQMPRKEGFEEQEQRGFALSVLDCPERLLMYAQSRDDSIAGQRLKFTALMCGFRAEDKPAKEKTT